MYAGDHDFPNLAFGYLIQSTISRGQVRAFDLVAAEQSPGVIAIFTPFNSLKLYRPLGFDEGANSGDVIPLLQDKQIHYFGQTIGLVVAESFEQARDAAALVKVIYEPGPASITLDSGMAKAYQPQSVRGMPATVSILEPGVSSIDDVLHQADVSIAQEYTTPVEHHNPMEPHATVAVWDEDRLTAYDATQWVGGHQRNLAAVLGADVDRVRVVCPFVGGAFGPVLGDSGLPPAPGAGGSQSTASVGPAVVAAAESVKKKLIEVAVKDQKSPFHGAKPGELSYAGGEIHGSGKSLSFDQLLATLGRSAIEATDSAAPGEEEEKYAFDSFGAQFCEVKVHDLTGEVRVNRFSSVMDIGTVVSEKTARSQIIGGIVFGIGMALLEETKYDSRTGWIANRNIAEDLVPTHADIPAIDVEFLNYPDSKFNSIGARGIGEIGITGTPAAVANAVYHATGRRIRQVPIRPEHLLA